MLWGSASACSKERMPIVQASDPANSSSIYACVREAIASVYTVRWRSQFSRLR